MIFVDTSVWVDHLRKGDKLMQALLDGRRVLAHPLIIGELAMGNLHPREAILRMLMKLPMAAVASHDETLQMISQSKLYGLGIGYIDAQLLAAVRLTPGTSLWTRDKRLAAASGAMGVIFNPDLFP